MKGIIYLVTNRITGKQYVGQTIRNDKIGHGKLITLAYKKYGKQNFDYDIIIESNISELDTLEKFYISYYSTISPNGYNLETGGKRGHHIHPSTRLRLIGRTSWCKGLTKYTDDRLRVAGEKLSATKKAKYKPSWSKGLTKIMDSRLYKLSLNMIRCRREKYWPSWCKGLTKYTDDRLRIAGEKQSITKKSVGIVAWNKGLTGIYSDSRIEELRVSGKERFNLKNPMNDPISRNKVGSSKIGRKIYIDENGNRKYTPRLDKLG